MQRKSRLTKSQLSKLMEHFVAGSTVRTTDDLIGINRNTVTNYFQIFREIISSKIEDETPVKVEIEVDESYFGGKRKGKRGRGAAGKVPVFGILKRKGKVYTQVITNTQSASLLPIIQRKVVFDSIVYTDTYKSYDALDISQFRHKRINHSTRFADKDNHINGIENFWNHAKRHLRRFNEIPQKYFHLYIKECVWRFNVGRTRELLRILSQWVKLEI